MLIAMTDASPSWADLFKQIADAKSATELDALEQSVFGRKEGLMTLAMKELKDLDDAKKKEIAKDLNTQKNKLSESLAKKRAELLSPSSDALAKDEKIDVTLNLPTKEQGHLHLVPEFMDQVEEVFGRMGFDVAYSPEIESEDLNFTQLNIPENHPARDAQDTFWIKNDGKEKSVLRTHTSPGQIRYMRSHKPPFRAIFPGKVYRKDADATHSPMFHQFEGLMIGENVTLANMKAVMITAIRELVSKDAEFRFRTGFFPFVEPGLEVDMRWQSEDSKTKEGDWLEIVGCGMTHPEVLRNCDIDPEKWQGFAFGFGIERMVMIKHQIPNIRSLFPGDLRFLKQF